VGSNASPACADVCPTSACVADPAHKENEEQLMAKAKKVNPKINFSGNFPSHFRK
jgi:Fe-S-cluster-containing dehydrogenase component